MASQHMIRAAVAAAAVACTAGTTWAQVADEVVFPSLDGTPLRVQVLRPAAPAKGTVVALHGCGGLYARQGPRQGRLTARHQAMADMLLQEGYAVVFPDSFTTRGETELCTQKPTDRRIDQTERRADALAAVAWVADQPWASPQRVALLGWSHGGGAVLASTDRTRRIVGTQAVKPVVAIAFYPGCAGPLRNGYRPATKLVLLLGEKDDWTPPGPCIELAKAVDAEVHVYPDSYHDFDAPLGEVRLRKEVPGGVNPGQGVHVGPNPQAREKAYARVRELLREAFAR